jgi:hypothetical protein
VHQVEADNRYAALKKNNQKSKPTEIVSLKAVSQKGESTVEKFALVCDLVFKRSNLTCELIDTMLFLHWELAGVNWALLPGSFLTEEVGFEFLLPWYAQTGEQKSVISTTFTKDAFTIVIATQNCTDSGWDLILIGTQDNPEFSQSCQLALKRNLNCLGECRNTEFLQLPEVLGWSGSYVGVYFGSMILSKLPSQTFSFHHLTPTFFQVTSSLLKSYYTSLMENLGLKLAEGDATVEKTLETKAIHDERYFFGEKQYFVGYDRLNGTWESKLSLSLETISKWKNQRKRIILIKDYMKDFPFPRPQPQPPEYYRITKLKVITLGVYVNRQFHCLMWSQYEAHKKSHDTCSALWVLYRTITNPTAHLIAWSDNCVSQNTCWMVLFFHAFLVKENYFNKVTLKQLKKGHTFNAVDARSGAIENSAHKKNMFTPNDWKQVMEGCKCAVHELKRTDFYKWEWLTSLFQKNKKTISNVEIKDIRGFYKYQFVSSDSGVSMRVKMSHKTSWEVINITKSNGKMIPPISEWEHSYEDRIPPRREVIQKLQVLVPYLTSKLSETEINHWFKPESTEEEEESSTSEDDSEQEMEDTDDRVFVANLLKKIQQSKI